MEDRNIESKSLSTNFADEQTTKNLTYGSSDEVARSSSRPSQLKAVERNAATVESLTRKRRASPNTLQSENSCDSIATLIGNTSSNNCIQADLEENAKKFRIISEANAITTAVNHVPAIGHRTAIDPTALSARGIVVIPGSHQAAAIRHPSIANQYYLGSNPSTANSNGLLCAQPSPIGPQSYQIQTTPSGATVLVQQSPHTPSVLPVQNQAQVAVPMTSAATTNFFTNTAAVPAGHQMINSAGKPVNMTYHTQKDTTFTKIFVGGLPYHTNDASLRKYFEQFGEIEEAVVITDRMSSCSKGYGFVSIIALYFGIYIYIMI